MYLLFLMETHTRTTEASPRSEVPTKIGPKVRAKAYSTVNNESKQRHHQILESKRNEIMTSTSKLNVLMIGTGEYTTGFVGGTAADSDKGSGVVALTLFDLRRRGKVHRLAMCGVNGRKFPDIRTHMQKQIGDVYKDMDLTLETFPADDQVYDRAYEDAIMTFQPGDVAVIFTPDDTHFEIAQCCIQRGMHVMVTKPIVQRLDHHRILSQLAKENHVLVGIEVHKRLDPFYADARDRARLTLGNFQYLYAYMSQPKHQLETFKSWAGKSSDISFYLNSHHVDFSEWTLAGIARPIRVTATASTGVAKNKGIETEDSITLMVQWRNFHDHTIGCAVYTSSWAAPKSDVHSQQRFFYMGSQGEITVDQAHRGYTVAMDNKAFASVNPLFMKFTPTNGYFSGQLSYGVRSIENFIDACAACTQSIAKPNDFDDGSIATVHTTFQGTAILEAGRISLDHDGQPVDILYESDESAEPIGLHLHSFS